MGTWTTTPRDWTDGEVVDESMLDAHLGDFARAFGAMSSYTPTWASSGTAPSLGNGTLVGAYTQIQKTVFFRITLTMGSTTTYGTGVYNWTLPVTASVGAGIAIAGTCQCYDSSVPAYRPRHAFMVSTTTVGASADDGTRVGLGAPFTWASGDVISLAGVFEAA